MAGPNISPDERLACRKRLERLWKSRTMDEGLLHRAWQTAYQVAPRCFTRSSARHKSSSSVHSRNPRRSQRSRISTSPCQASLKDQYDKAWNAIWDFKSGFKIDIINFDRSKGLFRERIKYQAIPIEREVPPVLWQTLYEHLQTTGFPRKPRRHLRNEPKKTHTTYQ